MTPRELARAAEENISEYESVIQEMKRKIKVWQEKLHEARAALKLGYEDRWPDSGSKS